MPFEFTGTRFLMCEGDDDKGFLESLIARRDLPSFQVCHSAECNDAGRDGKGVGGRSGFIHSLSGFKPIKGFSQVRAILLVSDNDTSKSFEEIQRAMKVNGHTAPSDPNQIGDAYGLPVAVLMVPSHTENGDLEKLCFPEIVRKWPNAERCVEAFLTCTGANAWGKMSSVNKARARSATVAFNEVEPYMGIGNLFRNGVLSVDNPCFDPIAEFFRTFDLRVGI
jgi:hypothetical protein